MESSATEPSPDAMLEYLKAQQPSYYFDTARFGQPLSNVELIAISGPTAAGKSTLMRAAVQNHGLSPLKSSMTREKAERDRNEPYHHFAVPVKTFYDGVKENSVVNYFVNKNEHVYGTFVDDFTAPHTIGAIGTSTIEQLSYAGFRDVRTLFTVMRGEDYAARLGLDRINEHDIIPRLLEGIDSIEFARRNIDEQWLTPLILSNEQGELERAAEDVSKITFQRSVQTVSRPEALKRLEEMEIVIEAALGRLGLVHYNRAYGPILLEKTDRPRTTLS